jgi:hypothetical protein
MSDPSGNVVWRGESTMAKPENWERMTELEKHDEALRVYRSVRGAFLIQEALE